jgi:hypothetical protein
MVLRRKAPRRPTPSLLPVAMDQCSAHGGTGAVHARREGVTERSRVTRDQATNPTGGRVWVGG